MTKKAEQIQKAELERKKRDLYKVYNPTDQDMKVVLNKKINPEEWTVQAKKETIVPWYVAYKYANKMADKIIYAKSDGAIVAENKKRMEKGFASMDLHTEQFRFESKIIKNMMVKKQDLFKILIIGLHKEYGIGEKGSEPDEKQTALNMQVDQSVDDVLGGRRVETATEAQKRSIGEDKAKEDKAKEQRLRALEKAREAKKVKAEKSKKVEKKGKNEG